MKYNHNDRPLYDPPNEAEAYDNERRVRRDTLKETINQLENLSFESADRRLEEVNIKRLRDGGYRVKVRSTSEFYV